MTYDVRVCNERGCDLPSTLVTLGHGPGSAFCVTHAIEKLTPVLAHLTERVELLAQAPVPGQLKLVVG